MRINSLRRWIIQHELLVRIGLFFVVGLICSYIFYLRFPNNFHQANFYAEDGRDFATNLINKGLIGSLFTAFNGYFIWGIYLLTYLGFILNSLLLSGGILTLPQAFALTSYLFMGFTVAIPVLLFRQSLGYVYATALALISSLVPLPDSDYAIIGTIGNLKWLFTYIAFLLVLCRIQAIRARWHYWLIDVGILICCYTNASTYFLIPFLFIPYFTGSRMSATKAWSSPGFKNLTLLCLLLLPQVFFVIVNGIPETPGYLDSSFDFSRTIEIFIGRSYLFGLLFPIYEYLNNLLALGLFAGIATGLFLLGKNKVSYVVGLVTVAVATLLFVFNRPGISNYFHGYKLLGPDQFFYAQNLIMYFVIMLWVREVSDRFRIQRVPAVGLLLVMVLYSQSVGSWGKKNFMAEQVGTIKINAEKACEPSTRGIASEVKLPLYPSEGFYYVAQADSLCSEIKR